MKSQLFFCKKKKRALTSFYYVSREIWLSNSKKLICIDLSKLGKFKNVFIITSKYFRFFNDKPPVRIVVP